MYDNKLSKEELQKLVDEIMNSSKTIEEAIDEKIDADELLDDVYFLMDKMYQKTRILTSVQLHAVKCIKAQLVVLKNYSKITNPYVTNIYESGIEKSNETYNTLLLQKNLLLEIKDSIKRLKKYRVGICNSDIFELLTLIYEKNEALIDELDDYIKKCSHALSGVTYYGNKDYINNIEKLDKEIDLFVKKLGLQNK